MTRYNRYDPGGLTSGRLPIVKLRLKFICSMLRGHPALTPHNVN